MPLSLVLGLGCALCWGFADFGGGLQARHLPALAVVLWSQIAGSIVLGVAILATEQSPPLDAVVWGAAAGAVGGVALLLFYRGLAVGLMSVVAPVSACGAAVPLVVALVRGEVPTPIESVGLLVAVAGVVLVSRPSGKRDLHPSVDRRTVLALALGAALGFGLFFVLIDQGTAATEASPLWVIGGVRVGSLLTMAALTVARPAALRWPGRRMGPVAAVGVLDTSASILLAFATVHGNLGVVAVLASQYPIVTVTLARLFLSERLSGFQAAGVAMALAGVGLLNFG
ncbi:EamA family transporter [soil metagenome]